jgi:hypothetical protein
MPQIVSPSVPSGPATITERYNALVASGTIERDPALCRHRRLGLLQLQSPRAEGVEGQAAAKVRMRVLPNGAREEKRRLGPILSAAGQMKSSTNAIGSPTQGTVS